MLYTDPDVEQIGRILLQEQDDESLRPVGYFIQTFKDVEHNYETTESDFFTTICAVLMLRTYLEGARFTNFTEYDSLKCFWTFNHI